MNVLSKAPYQYPKHKISAERAQALLAEADADMARARQLDNGPQDLLPETGVVRVPEGDSFYNRRIQGDSREGTLQGDFVRCVFRGESVTVHENYHAYTGREQKIYNLNRANLAECTVQNILSGW
ncbi:MAG: hypothetical protein J0I12_07400 [Candidatus Eremiobacteraeota bacterium]|nr:hypothetical protein [Candidatus Eremiobacteraeota bacterium]